jgi:hypothetical protein
LCLRFFFCGSVPTGKFRDAAPDCAAVASLRVVSNELIINPLGPAHFETLATSLSRLKNTSKSEVVPVHALRACEAVGIRLHPALDESELLPSRLGHFTSLKEPTVPM